MKKVMLLACAAAAALMTGQETAEAQCRYGGGYSSGYGGYGGGYGGISYGTSIGYSRYSPGSSFSIGFSSAPRVSYQRSTYRNVSRVQRSYRPSTVYRHGNHYHAQPVHSSWRRGRSSRRW